MPFEKPTSGSAVRDIFHNEYFSTSKFNQFFGPFMKLSKETKNRSKFRVAFQLLVGKFRHANESSRASTSYTDL